MQQGHGKRRLELRLDEHPIRRAVCCATHQHRSTLLRRATTGAFAQSEPLSFERGRAGTHCLQELLLFIPTGDDAGRTANQTDRLAEQVFQQAPGLGFGCTSADQAQQGFAAAMHHSHPLGGDEPGFDV